MGFTTQRSFAAVASSLLALTLSARHAHAVDLKPMTYKGCYSSSSPLTDQGYYQYQTNGYCQPICVQQNQAVLGLSKGSDCWCGGQLPPASSKVDESKCNTPCNGFGDQKCGGDNYFSVWLTGTSTDVTNFQGQANSNPSNSNSDSTPATTAAPSVVTSISPGNTVVITVSASATNSSNNNGSSGGTSTAGVAAGVVVGIVGAAAIAGGIFFLLRRRRRQRAEDDYKRSAQVSDFMSHSNERKPPTTAYSQMSDSRLDPEHGRRNSVGSMADDHDYSRRILRVANPDSH